MGFISVDNCLACIASADIVPAIAEGGLTSLCLFWRPDSFNGGARDVPGGDGHAD